MRCLSCHYDLKKLAENRCPECGREFDPNDPVTFDTPWTRWKRFLSRRIGHLLLLCLGTYFLAFAICFYLVSTDTVYVPDTDSSPSEWGLSFQLFVAVFKAAGMFALLIPFTTVLYVALSITAARSSDAP